LTKKSCHVDLGRFIANSVGGADIYWATL